MKRTSFKAVLIILLCITVCFTLASCIGGDSTDNDKNSDNGGNTETHQHSYTEAVTEPTCTEQGYTIHTCTCGDRYVDTYTNALGHKYTNYVSDGNATCTEDGTKTAACDRCSTVKDTVTMSKIYHNYVDGFCTMCGEEEPLYARVDTNGNSDASGEYILFGSYPQTEVTDSALKSSLDSRVGMLPTIGDAHCWTSYGYYMSGSISNYMWYTNIEYEGEIYRGVYFTSYRPFSTSFPSNADISVQDDNGYYTSTVYWFKYEPIKWRILTEEGGKALLLCEMLIDSREYDESRNNYANSNIRAWLNDTFYNTAFTELQKALINVTEVDNSAASTGYYSNSHACANTNDKIFLLSYAEVINTDYGFASDYLTYDSARQKKTTDYAQCQGAYTYDDGNVYWWLRSPYDDYNTYYDNSKDARYVNNDGSVSDGGNHRVTHTRLGVCPALWISLS